MNNKSSLNQFLLILAITLILTGCVQPNQGVTNLDSTPESASAAPVVESESDEAESTKADQLLELPQNIDVETVAEIQDRGDIFLLDVREQSEYDAGHIPNITLIPTGSVANRLSEIPQDKTVIVTCHSGARSARITNYLLQNGFTNVHNMEGGIVAWSQAGYAVER